MKRREWKEVYLLPTVCSWQSRIYVISDDIEVVILGGM